MSEPQFQENKQANMPVEIGKTLVKKALFNYLKVPLMIGVGVLFLILCFAGLIFSFALQQEEAPITGTGTGTGGWEIGNITEFGANEIPAAYIPIYKAAAEKYGVPWNLLAAHHRIETTFSTISPMISPVGAIGHMQFMPLTWIGWSYPGDRLGNANIPEPILTSPAMIKKYGGYGTDGDGDGKADPMNLTDAVFSAAKYLAANGAASGNLRKAVYAYNHSAEYVNDVLKYTGLYVSGYTAVNTNAGPAKVVATGGMAGVMKSAEDWTKQKTKYVWGAGRTQSQIDKGWFDCSGFIYAMLHANGIKWPTGNTDTLITQGKRVPADQMQVGDLIFFDTYKVNGHVGFYAGNGQFIGSQSSSGVSYRSMTTGYFAEKFRGVVIRVN